MTHQVQLVFAGEALTGFLAARTRATGYDDKERTGLRAAGMQDDPTPYVGVPHVYGTHYVTAAAQSSYFRTCIHDRTEQDRLWAPQLCESAARVVGARRLEEAGAKGETTHHGYADGQGATT